MGTMADDGAIPPRRTTIGNGGVAGSSITSEGQSGSWLQSKTNVRRIVNQFLLSTDERQQLAGLPPTFDSIAPDQACNETLYEEFAGYLQGQALPGGPCGQLLEQSRKAAPRQAQTCE